MIYSDLLTYFYLLWPITIGVLILCFIIGILIALSVGSFLVGFLLVVYYGYIYLKERGFFEWIRENMRKLNQRFCKNIRETFVLRGASGKVEEPTLYIAHPHGLYSMAPFFHWGACLTEWPKDKKVHLAIHSIFFKIPIVREIVEAHGAIEAKEENIRAALAKGESVAILTGGIRELQETEPGKMRLILGRRNGFLRIAKSMKVPIVPILSFGENELFPPYRIVWFEWIQKYIKEWFGVYLPIPTASSIVNWITLLNEPLPSKVETWIGDTIETKKGSIESIRKQVFDAIRRLYAEGKPTGYSDEIEIY